MIIIIYKIGVIERFSRLVQARTFLKKLSFDYGIDKCYHLLAMPTKESISGFQSIQKPDHLLSGYLSFDRQVERFTKPVVGFKQGLEDQLSSNTDHQQQTLIQTRL